MKRLAFIFVVGLFLSACNSEESDIFSYMEKDLQSQQTRDKEENDSVSSSGIGFILESDEFEEEFEEVNL